MTDLEENYGWGTSVILMPCFWEQDVYHQGALISVAIDTVKSNPNLIISFTSDIDGIALRSHLPELAPTPAPIMGPGS